MSTDIEEIDPSEALARQQRGALLVDVREDDERAGGMAQHAIGLPLAHLSARIAAIEPRHARTIVTLCASGKRSLRAAQMLRELGYTDLASVRGGFIAWNASALPLADGGLGSDALERYSRHLLLPEIGASGQARLRQARIVIVGAGGLGSPVALYLAAAGVGRLSIIDDDRVDKSNLQRQIVHTDARVGMAKTESARQTLLALNPTIEVVAHAVRVRADNVESLIGDHDVVIDAADNFPTRYLLSAACRQLRLPLVYGAVHRFSGQVSVFDARDDASPCYRCLFPEPPAAADAPNCAEAGVLGVLPGSIGMMQATEALKLVLGIGAALVGRLLCYDALAASYRELHLPRDPDCPGCGRNARFEGYADLAQLCAQ